MLEESASRKRKRLYPVERGTAGLHEQARVFVARCVIDTHRDTTNRIDNGFETLEIDFDIVMNGNVQRALHGAHQHVGAQLIGGIYALAFVAIADVHPQVARYRQQRNRSCCFHVVHHHQGVTSLATDVALGANIVVVRIRRVGASARIGTNKQIVFKVGMRGRQRGGGNAFALHAI